MSRVQEMLEAHPHDWGGLDRAKLTECIEACFDCAQICTACADACLAEDTVSQLVQCIRSDLDCADVCATTGRVLSRHAGADPSVTKALLEEHTSELQSRQYLVCRLLLEKKNRQVKNSKASEEKKKKTKRHTRCVE